MQNNWSFNDAGKKMKQKTRAQITYNEIEYNIRLPTIFL